MLITRRLEFDAGHRIPDHQSQCRYLHGHRYDHAFLVYAGDLPVVSFLASLSEHKTVLLDCVPTAENLVQKAFSILEAVYRDRYGKRLRLYETPNCWAEAVRE